MGGRHSAGPRLSLGILIVKRVCREVYCPFDPEDGSRVCMGTSPSCLSVPTWGVPTPSPDPHPHPREGTASRSGRDRGARKQVPNPECKIPRLVHTLPLYVSRPSVSVALSRIVSVPVLSRSALSLCPFLSLRPYLRLNSVSSLYLFLSVFILFSFPLIDSLFRL